MRTPSHISPTMNAAVVHKRNPLSENDGYHFISNRHSTTGFEEMHTMQRQGKLCDIVITVGGEVYRGHKLVFASFSEFFSDMFDENLEANCQVRIDDISPAAFRSILQFFYTGEIVLSIVNVKDLILASKKYKIDLLKAACAESMSILLNPSTWIQIKAFADGELNQKCHAYALQHFEDIANTDTFLQLSFCDIKELIADDELAVPSDEAVYSAVLKWVKYDLPNRGPNLPQLMAYVKLPLIDKSYMMTNVNREPLMKDNLECCKLLLEATEYHLGVQGEQLSSRTRPRKYFGGASYIFVTGGRCGNKRLAECELYNPRTNAWRSFSSMQSIRSGHSLIGFRKCLFAFGGWDQTATSLSSVEYYDPLKDSWSMTTSLPYERYAQGVCALGNSIYIGGGLNKSNVVLNNVEQFDPEAAVYMTSTSMKNQRGYFNMAAIDKCIYAIGGQVNGQPLKSMEVFDPREGKWFDAPSISKPRQYHGIGIMNGHIYTETGGNDWERFNIRSNKWEPIPNTSGDQDPLNPVGCVYILGSSIEFVKKYDITKKSVIEMPPMVNTRHHLSATIMDCLEIKHSN